MKEFLKRFAVLLGKVSFCDFPFGQDKAAFGNQTVYYIASVG